MGKFNLSQILNEASKAAAGGGSDPRPAESRFQKISVFDLIPSENNFYSMREIDELKTAIEIAGKVLQNLIVVPLEGGKYKVVAGHRRRLASIALVKEGKAQYEFVPCDIEPNEEAAEDQEIRDGFLLIVTNSQREKTAWDKIEEVRYLREILEKAKTSQRFAMLLQQIAATAFGADGIQADGTRDFIAKTLHTSSSQIGRYDAITRNLCPEFKRMLKEDKINISTAYELSGLLPVEQQAAFTEYEVTGEISIKAARERKQSPAPVTEEFEKTTDEPQEIPNEPIPTMPERAKPETAFQQQLSGTGQPGKGDAEECPNGFRDSAGSRVTPQDDMEQPAPPPVFWQADVALTPEAGTEDQYGIDELTQAIERLESLLAYCLKMERENDHARAWKEDADALSLAIDYISWTE